MQPFQTQKVWTVIASSDGTSQLVFDPKQHLMAPYALKVPYLTTLSVSSISGQKAKCQRFSLFHF